MMRMTLWISSGVRTRSAPSAAGRRSRYHVSGGMQSREWDARMRRSSVEPERPDPMMKNGAEFTISTRRRASRSGGQASQAALNRLEFQAYERQGIVQAKIGIHDFCLRRNLCKRIRRPHRACLVIGER